MAISDAQFAVWSKNHYVHGSGTAVTLIEIDYVAEVAGAPVTRTLYFASKAGYVSAATDTPASTPYVDRIQRVPTYTRTLDRTRLGGRYSVSYGTLEISNADGAQDPILLYAYDGSAYRQYFGDLSWPKSDFRLIFTAMGASISAPGPTTIVFSIKDSSSLLKANLTGANLVGGTGPYANRPRPLNLGFVHNVEFLFLESLPLLKYVYSNSTTETYVVAVRDRGYDLAGGWTDNVDGTVTLDATPAGLITGDLQHRTIAGDFDSYRTSNIFQSIAGEFGGLTALGLFHGAHSSFVEDDDQDYHVGYSIYENRSILDILDEFAESTNTFYAVRRDNKFTFGRIFVFNPSGASVLDLVEDDIAPANAIKVNEIVPEFDQVQCTGNRNWTQQSDLSSSLNAGARAVFERKGYPFSEPDPTGTTYVENPGLYHKTLGKSPIFDTFISKATDADVLPELTKFAEIRRKKFLARVRLVDLSVGLRAYVAEIGDVVTLTLPRFGFDAGPRAQVIGIAIDQNDESVDLTLAHRASANATVTDGFIIQLAGAGYVLQFDAVSKLKIAA